MAQNPADHPTDSGDMWECSKLKWKQMDKKYPLCFALSFLWGMLPEVFDPNSLLRKCASELGWNNTGNTVYSSGYSLLSGYTVEDRDRQLSFFLFSFETFLVMVSRDSWAPSGINLIHKKARRSWTVWCQTEGQCLQRNGKNSLTSIRNSLIVNLGLASAGWPLPLTWGMWFLACYLYLSACLLAMEQPRLHRTISFIS